MSWAFTKKKIAKVKNKKLAEIKLHHTHISFLCCDMRAREWTCYFLRFFFGPVRALWTLNSKLMLLRRNFAENYIKYSDSLLHRLQLNDVFFTATFKRKGWIASTPQKSSNLPKMWIVHFVRNSFLNVGQVWHLKVTRP